MAIQSLPEVNQYLPVDIDGLLLRLLRHGDQDLAIKRSPAKLNFMIRLCLCLILHCQRGGRVDLSLQGGLVVLPIILDWQNNMIHLKEVEVRIPLQQNDNHRAGLIRRRQASVLRANPRQGLLLESAAAPLIDPNLHQNHDSRRPVVTVVELVKEGDHPSPHLLVEEVGRGAQIPPGVAVPSQNHDAAGSRISKLP
jgi:hypothetical protein